MPQNHIGRATRRLGICCRVAFLLLSGLHLYPPAAAVLAQDAPVGQPASDHRFADHIAEASRRFRIPEHWIRAILDAESAQDIRAVSSAGAIGLMQIMPDTWTELRARHRLGDDPFEPRDNILAGTAYLREMLDRYGSVGAMLAAYNAGPGRYDEYLAAGRPLPAETRAYVAALTPLLGGDPPADGTATPLPRPIDWREAPLFVGSPGDDSAAGSVHPGGQSEIEAKAEAARDDDAAARPPGSIFIARSGEDTAP